MVLAVLFFFLRRSPFWIDVSGEGFFLSLSLFLVYLFNPFGNVDG